MSRPACPDPRYASLWGVLMDAWDQATAGKGAQRHGTEDPYEAQPTAMLLRQLGSGGASFQACKKLLEAHRAEGEGHAERARTDRLGAIVYTALAQIESDRSAS